jgi:hypothetical protein
MPGIEIVNSFEFIDFSCIFLGKDVPSLPLDQVLVMAQIPTPSHVPYFPYLHIHSPYSLVLLTLAHRNS